LEIVEPALDACVPEQLPQVVNATVVLVVGRLVDYRNRWSTI
jgi:hypothetical protein